MSRLKSVAILLIALNMPLLRAASVYIEKPVGDFQLKSRPGAAYSEFTTRFQLARDAFGRDLALKLTNDPTMKQTSNVEVWVNGQKVHRNPVHPGRDAWSVIPFNFLRFGENELTIRLPGGFAHKFRGIEYLSHSVVAGAAPRAPANGADHVLETYVDREYDWAKGSVTLWAMLVGKDMQPVKEAQGRVSVNGKEYPFRFSTGAFNGLQKWGFLYSKLPGRYEAEIPLADLTAGTNPARIVFKAAGHADSADWYPIYNPATGKGEPASSASGWKRIRKTILFRHSISETKPREWPFDILIPNRPDIAADLEKLLVHERVFEFGEVASLLRTIQGMGGASYFGTNPNSGVRERFDDYTFLLNTNGFTARAGGTWDKGVVAGGFWDKLLHVQHRFFAYPGDAESPVPKCGNCVPADAFRRGGDFAADGKWQMRFEIAGHAPGATASVPAGAEVTVAIVVTAPSTIALVELISDVKGKPGEVVAEWRSPQATLELRHKFTAGNSGYFRMHAKDIAGNHLYSNPIFLDVRGSRRESVVARSGVPAFFDSAPKKSPETVRVSFSQRRSPLPVVMGAAFTRKVEIELIPEADGIYILEAGLDSREVFEGEKAIGFSLNGAVGKSYRAFHPVNLPKPKFTRNLVPFRFELGCLRRGVPALITLESASSGDGIGITYFHVISSSFPVAALTDMHQHSLAAQEYGNKLSRTMGYNYSGTGHIHDEAERTKAGTFSGDGLIIQAAGEVNNGFGSCHVALAFPEAVDELQAVWKNSRDNSFAAAFEMSGAPILNHPYSDRRLAWVQQSGDWGASEEYFHGYAGWDHLSGHYGWVEQQWQTLTLFELFNGYDWGGRMAGNRESQSNAELRWHEELNDYIYGRRRAPVFATAGSDVKTFFENPQDFYIGNMVHAAAFDRPALESATFAGRLVVAGAAHVRLLVSLTDAQGQVYVPGNKVAGKGPYKLHIEAWSPKRLSRIRIVDPKGVSREFTIDENFVVRDIVLDSLPPLYWFYVLVRGDELRTTALSNPFFVGVP